MAQKYPQKKIWVPRSHLPQCCLSRTGQVKLKFESKPKGDKVPQGQEPYECRRGDGWHLRKKRDRSS